MKIKSLTVSGFKSFCDETRIQFNTSLTAVVGPNGCGKSNIVDAIRWALGEQSPRNLRGKGMGDVIFGGSESRGPRSMAEVTITFDNTDGLSPPLYQEYPEIAITRRLHRDGTSEYLINRTPCRLKDVTEMFMGTGGGARAYSIIEQGRIGLIVSSRSEDRRAMIEEAAGITRFKKGREMAQNRMEQTRQNLLRIRDVVEEMGRNLGNLQRQARKAERYNQYAAEQRDAELQVASHQYLEQLAVKKSIEARLELASGAYDTLQNELTLMETRLEQLRIDETTARMALETARKTAVEADTGITLTENGIHHLEDRLAQLRKEDASLQEQQSSLEQRMALSVDEREVLQVRLNAIAEDVRAMENAREALEQRALEARERLSVLGRDYDVKRDHLSRSNALVAASRSALEGFVHRIEESETRLNGRREDATSLHAQIDAFRDLVSGFLRRSQDTSRQLDELKAKARTEGEAYERFVSEVAACELERERVREELLSRTSRLDSLHQMNDSMQRHDNGVRQAVESLRAEGVPGFDGMLIDYIQCPRDLNVALAAVLESRLQSLVTRDHCSGFEVLSWLKKRDLGRVQVVPRETNCVLQKDGARLEGPGIRGKLMDFLTVEESVRKSVHRLLTDVYVVDNEEVTQRLWETQTPRISIVTLDGQFADATGILSGGRAGSVGADLLDQKREIQDLEIRVNALRGESETLEQRFESQKEEMRRSGELSEQARADVQRMEFLLSEIHRDQSRSTEDLEAALERRAHLDRDVEMQTQQLNALRQDRDRVQGELAAASRDVESLSVGLAEQSAFIEAVRDDADRLAADVTEAKLREAQVRHQHCSSIERTRQISVLEQDISSQVGRISGRRAEIVAEMERTDERIVTEQEKRLLQLSRVDGIHNEVLRLSRELENKSATFQEHQQLFRDKRATDSNVHDELSQLQMTLQKAHSDISYLLMGVREKHDVHLPRILGDYHLSPVPGSEMIDRIEELKGLIHRMGPINLMAIEEYADLHQKYEQKLAQKTDVEQALEDLEETISRMDRESRRLFKETFDAVNGKFQEIFPRLFKGGSARLLLTDPDDMLKTGVDIQASPPGKKLLTIELMSGGEKALTAVSLLFAIFLQRPSPFCLLDEVDAPLDEANVGRFVEMVREMTDRSQFVIITHSKITMEGADTLYGVTMQEPGVSKMISVSLVHREVGQIHSERVAN